MANKSRPKKTRVPYRKYVAGQGYINSIEHRTEVDLVLERDLDEELEGPTDRVGRCNRSTIKGSEFTDLNIDESSSFSGSKPRLESVAVENATHQNSGQMVFPWELQRLILQKCADIQPRFLCVCKRWYFMYIPIIYRAPVLTSKNFLQFVESLVSDRKKKLGEFVVELDLSTIIQSGKNSFISKLLRRCSPSLEYFMAPQTSFGLAPLISLKACNKLRFLDLGLLSETVHLKNLFEAIKGFPYLTHLSFPRSSIQCEGFREMEWPKNLQCLKLSGGISNEFVMDTNFPQSITTLEFSYCPQVDENAIYTILSKVGDNLKRLLFHYPMPALNDNSLDYVFRYCSNLVEIQLVVDYCSKWVFSENFLLRQVYPRPLKCINLECSGSLGQAFKIHPDDLTIALAEDRLPRLQSIRISSKLGWDTPSDDLDDLISIFEEKGGSVYIVY
ncbi:Pfu1p Ecym_3205 [Eremothecium cymbalariae DBVPG|uniref:F-box domain-containing protein n=1 Tax=Eremothecium cymbalariae (strain CBS 270.75 / DBVPG 7215 / KCTC 17166 / NRRL Y-17582) TaxID=931890 RepID=G8JRD5_ERECY|nr:Hypothetical protein Ecym_3205 [Eremothecium cymbalariae DBVPG\